MNLLTVYSEYLEAKVRQLTAALPQLRMQRNPHVGDVQAAMILALRLKAEPDLSDLPKMLEYVNEIDKAFEFAYPPSDVSRWNDKLLDDGLRNGTIEAMMKW